DVQDRQGLIGHATLLTEMGEGPRKRALFHSKSLRRVAMTSSCRWPLVATTESPTPGVPSQVENPPPASVITGYSAAASQMLMSGSSITSARPPATIRYP